MALDSSMRMGLIDISIMHILRKKKQSPKRTAKKILDTFHNIYPDVTIPSENDPSFRILETSVEANDFLNIRSFLQTLLSGK